MTIEEFFTEVLPKMVSSQATFNDYSQKIARPDKVAIFIGAGLSTNYGCSSWHNLAHKLLDECRNHGGDYLTVESLKKSSNDYKILITIAKSILPNDAFISCVKKSLNLKDNPDGSKKLIPIEPKGCNMYKHLYELFSYFITTNADTHIDDAFTKVVIEDFDNYDPSNLNQKVLYKIHGCITKPESMIFTSDKYIREYGQEGTIGKFLKSVFATHKVVFIGYGLSEFEVLERLLESQSDQQQNEEKKHYIILGYYKHEDKLREAYNLYFRQLGVEQVYFYKDTNGYDELKNKLNEYYLQVENKKKPLELFKLIDDALMELLNDQ